MAQQLTTEQTEAARKLLAARPAVLPGTRAIINDRARVAWYKQVTAEGMRLDVFKSPETIAAFCDAAGVAD